MPILNMRMWALGLATLLIPLDATAATLAHSDVLKFHKSVGGLAWSLGPTLDLPPNSPEADRHALCVLKIRIAQVRAYEGVLELMGSADDAESIQHPDDSIIAEQRVAFVARVLLHDTLPQATTQIQTSLPDCEQFPDVTYEGKRLITAIDRSVVETQSLLDKVAGVPAPYTGGHDN